MRVGVTSLSPKLPATAVRRPHQERTPLPRWRSLRLSQHLSTCAILFLAAAMGACAESPEDVLGAPGDGGPLRPWSEGDADDEGVLGGACPLGATRACSVEHSAGCAEGTQYCVDGTWSECRRDVTRGLQRRDLSDTASICGEDGTTPNACDADCRAFAPDPPDFGEGIAPIAWETGTLGSLPAAALAAARTQPCDSSSDCNIDHYCEEGPAPRACFPYNPFDGNAACGANYDVTAAVGCVAAGVRTVPLCNRGNVPIPRADLANFRIRHVAAPPFAMDGCSLTGSGVRECAVTATADLDVGACMNVACDGMTSRSRIYVDTGAGNTSECDCGNNWSFNADGACGEPACGNTVATAEEVPVTILLALDVSGSMDTGSPTRLDSVKAAMEAFVSDPASAQVGVALKFWPEGRCERPSNGKPGACDADAPYVDEGTCDVHPCETSAGTLAPVCNADVATVCNTSTFERCCGDMPKAGTCAFPPCTTSASTLVKSCSSDVTTTCNQNGLQRCCGGWVGTCASDPCSPQGASLSSCNDNNNAAVKDVCDDFGFERCCGGTLPSAGAWGTSRAPCTAAAGSTMQCLGSNGAAVACSSLTIPAAQTSSRAARMKAFLAIAAGAGCQTSWTAACVTSFRSYWDASFGTDPCAPAQWNATCVAQWRTKVPADACTKQWDSACSANYASRVSSSSSKRCTQTKSWNATCVSKFDEVSGGSCTACDHPSIPRSASSIDDYRLELQADASTSLGGTDGAEQQLVNAIRGARAGGNTPTHPALTGAIDFGREYQAAHPDSRSVVVFATDGEPYGCNPSGSLAANSSDLMAIRAVAAAGRAEDIYTYAVGIDGSSTTFMNQLAASGGTSAAFVLGSGSQATADLKAALIAIRNKFACSYSLPNGVTQSQITVRWNDGDLDPQITKVTNLPECGAVPLGYYAESANSIALCPRTCESIRSASGTNVEIVVGCGEQAVPTTVTEDLSAGSACDGLPGTYPRWTVMLYDANVPEGSSIVVSARTRLDQGSDWSDLYAITTITSANENASLLAPIPVGDVLGTDAFARDIEVTFTSTVGGGAPQLLGYELELTCAASE